MSKILFVVICLIFGTLCSDTIPKSNIVGDNEVTSSFKYSWLARITKEDEHQCSGILINESTLITASHCSKENPRVYDVEVHRYNTSKSLKEENSQILTVKKFFKHETYDLAVWKLSTPAQNITFDFELDSGEEIPEKTIVKTLGWGQLYYNGPLSNTLQEVDIPTFNTALCGLTWILRDRTVVPTNHICAGGEGGRDACFGDSGSPLILKKDNRIIILGITAFGYPCAPRGFPTVWTKVAPLMEFINANK